MGLDQAGCMMPGEVLWVAVGDMEETAGVKLALKKHGYPNVRTFEGWMQGSIEPRLIVQGSKTTFYNDPKGRGEKLYALACEMGVEPLYAYAFSGTLSIDLGHEDHALSLYQALQNRGLPDVEVRPDAMSSFDVWQVAVRAA